MEGSQTTKWPFLPIVKQPEINNTNMAVIHIREKTEMMSDFGI
jgi:hypothetical protein